MTHVTHVTYVHVIFILNTLGIEILLRGRERENIVDMSNVQWQKGNWIQIVELDIVLCGKVSNR